GRLVSLWVAGLAIATPWMVLSSFLLTEVVAYPAFCWAVLALSVAVDRKAVRFDAVALASIGVAILARTQFAVLLVVFGVAVIAEALLEASGSGARGREIPRSAVANLVRTRRVLLGVYAGGAVALVAALIIGGAGAVLGSYSVTASDIRVNLDLVRLTAEHLASLALATAILPFVVGAAWLVDRLRPSAPPAARAFASVGCAAIILLGVEVASFNQRFAAGQVNDRYVFYVLPLVLVGLGASLVSRSWPRWWAWIVPLGVVVAGLATRPLPVYEKLNVDSPVAILHDQLLRLTGSVYWAHVALPLASIVLVALLVELTVFLPRRVVVVTLAALVTIALPGGLVYAFDRLFSVNGTNGLPVTLDQGVVFNWVDRSVGPQGRVTVYQYPVNSPDYWAGVAYWWDAEFWNESVVVMRDFGAGTEEDAPWASTFDSTSGAVLQPGSTGYVVSHGSDVRFRLAARQVTFERGAYLLQPQVPWRAEWVTSQIYGDGWTKPHVPVRIRVYAKPGQQTALRRFLTLSVASPAPLEPRPLTIRSNLDVWNGFIPPDGSIDRGTSVCVPPGGYADVEIETPHVSDVYRDPTEAPLTGETDRPVGVLLRSIAVADETELAASCPAEPFRS
ncbi:hypothetical protein, partial [Gaiella sp.]|uniref:hypothetical protein n=1 Tax=Gaiella sp. TaxID=2663207 RepID=UPI0032659D6B